MFFLDVMNHPDNPIFCAAHSKHLETHIELVFVVKCA